MENPRFVKIDGVWYNLDYCQNLSVEKFTEKFSSFAKEKIAVHYDVIHELNEKLKS